MRVFVLGCDSPTMKFIIGVFPTEEAARKQIPELSKVFHMDMGTAHNAWYVIPTQFHPEKILLENEVLIFRLLWDFMKDLPMNFDPANFSVVQCHDIIEKFMVNHGLKDVKDEDQTI